jgi:DHA1 family tetracycline resistance protein-like MFS transporter
MAVFFLYWLAHAVYPSVWAFVGAYRYNWNEAQIGLSLGMFGIGTAFVMAVVLPRALPILGERRTAITGVFFSCLGMIGYAIAWEGWMVYAVILMTALEGFADPPLRSIAASKVPPSAQGELQGALTSVSSITTIIGPLLFTQLFSHFTGTNAPFDFAGMPYAVGAGLIFIALVVVVARVHPKPKPKIADV